MMSSSMNKISGHGAKKRKMLRVCSSKVKMMKYEK